MEVCPSPMAVVLQPQQRSCELWGTHPPPWGGPKAELPPLSPDPSGDAGGTRSRLRASRGAHGSPSPSRWGPPPVGPSPAVPLTRSSSTGVSMAAAPCRLKQATTVPTSRSRSATCAGGWSRVPCRGTES